MTAINKLHRSAFFLSNRWSTGIKNEATGTSLKLHLAAVVELCMSESLLSGELQCECVSFKGKANHVDWTANI